MDFSYNAPQPCTYLTAEDHPLWSPASVGKRQLLHFHKADLLLVRDCRKSDFNKGINPHLTCGTFL